MKTFTRFAFAALLVCALTPSIFAADKKASAKVLNKSDWDIHHLYLSPVDEEEWGPDQLGKHVLESGGTFTLTGIPCDTYDVKVVDEDGDACEIEDVDLCAGHSVWFITNEDLLACEGYH